MTCVVIVTERQAVLTEAQCAHVIERHRGDLQPSSVTVGQGRILSPVRRSSSCKLGQKLSSDIRETLNQAVVEATGASSDRFESWELIHYSIGDFYLGHVDWFSSPALPGYSCGGQRTHSAIVYLSEVEKGGETFFPKLGRLIKPQVGMLVTWNNLVDGALTYQVLHEARPVVAGEKWVLVTWIRERTYIAVA